MKKAYRLVVESGPEKGKSFAVPERGCGLGRSSQNEIALKDEQLSRLHCRFHFRDEKLWVTDLASANGTLVDGAEVTERELANGSKVGVGDTVLRVVAESAPASTSRASAVTIKPVGSEPATESSAEEKAAVDLGLAENRRDDAPAVERRVRRTLLWSLACFVALIAAALVVRRMLEAPVAGPSGVRPLASADAPTTLELRYEKLEGSAENIFRYDLSLDERGRLAVQIDDIAQRRHVRRESPGTVDPELVRELVHQIEQAGFFGLDPTYEGIPLPNTHAVYDLTVVLGADARRVRVANRNEPEAFRTVRERIETFARNELGLWAVEFSHEKLEKLANDAYLLGAKLVREKDIQVGNLYRATQSFRECEHYLETVEPKPAFLTEALAALREANSLLDERYKDLNLAADRAINLKDWEVAATHLRELLELIPDRVDDRHRDAERRLLDVESRIRTRR